MKAEKWQRFTAGRKYMSDVVIPAFRRLGLEKQVEQLQSCGRFVYAAECLSCHTRHFAGFNHCRSRWCVCCNHVRVLAWLARLLPIMQDWILAGGRVSMLNFTIRNVAKLSDGVDILNDSFRSLYNTPKKRSRWKTRFPGGVRSLEVKRGSGSGKWHPHLHCLVLQPSDYEKDFEWLRVEWENITARYFTKKGYTDDGKVGSVWIKNINRDNLLKSCCEVIKYILKPEPSIYEDDEALIECWETLAGKRQINTWGILRGLSRKIEEDVENEKEKALAEFVCQRCGCSEAYLVTMLYDTIDILYDLK